MMFYMNMLVKINLLSNLDTQIEGQGECPHVAEKNKKKKNNWKELKKNFVSIKLPIDVCFPSKLQIKIFSVLNKVVSL